MPMIVACGLDDEIGNEGTTIERFYKAAAIAMWMNDDDFRLLVSGISN
jgi:hypothetical protein